MAGKTEGKGHERNRLSAAFVENVTEPGRYQDGGGLFLQVDATGGKRWMQRLMVRGKRHDLGIGPLALVSLAEARKAARANKDAARKGQDPITERAAVRTVPTFAEAAEAVLAIKAAELSNPKHVQQWQNTLAQYAGPIIGHLKVSEITTGDVVRVLKPIWTTKTETASRLRGRIEAVLDWATVSGHRSGENPARWKGTLQYLLPAAAKVAVKDHHPALAIADAQRWFFHLQRRGGTAAQCLQFVALTWCRSGEARGARWSEIDLDRRIWTVPATRMKAGKEHRVALSQAAIGLLARLPRIEGTDLIFPAPRGGMMSDMALSMAMRRMHDAAIEVPWPGGGYFDPRSGRPAVPHGLRSVARDWAAEEGHPRDLAELNLAHEIAGDVELAYRRSDMLERRRAIMDAWAAFLSRRPVNNVRTLRPAR